MYMAYDSLKALRGSFVVDLNLKSSWKFMVPTYILNEIRNCVFLNHLENYYASNFMLSVKLQLKKKWCVNLHLILHIQFIYV